MANTPEQDRNVDRSRRSVHVEVSTSGDRSIAYETVSKLVSLLVDCEDEGISLKVDFYGVKAKQIAKE